MDSPPDKRGRTPTRQPRVDGAPRRPRPSPWRLLLPMALGMALLAWLLELGRERRRAPVEERGGPLVEVPSEPTP